MAAQAKRRRNEVVITQKERDQIRSAFKRSWGLLFGKKD